MKTLLAAALTVVVAGSAMADETEGHVLAYDRSANIIVLTDKTEWSIPATIALPDDLGRGDRVLFEYDSAGEDGLTAINMLTRLAMALPEGTDGGS